MKELISSKAAGPWLTRFFIKCHLRKYSHDVTGTVIIRNTSLWPFLEMSGSQTKVKKRNLETNGEKNQKGHQ